MLGPRALHEDEIGGLQRAAHEGEAVAPRARSKIPGPGHDAPRHDEAHSPYDLALWAGPGEDALAQENQERCHALQGGVHGNVESAEPHQGERSVSVVEEADWEQLDALGP